MVVSNSSQQNFTASKRTSADLNYHFTSSLVAHCLEIRGGVCVGEAHPGRRFKEEKVCFCNNNCCRCLHQSPTMHQLHWSGFFSGQVILPLFHEYLFRKRPVPFGLIRNGPISSDAPYATEEHPGPAKGSALVFLKLLDSVLLPSMRNADAAKSDLMANRTAVMFPSWRQKFKSLLAYQIGND